MISAARWARPGALPVLIAQLFFCIVLLAPSAAARIPGTQDIDDDDRSTALAAVQLAGPFEYPWSIAFLPDHSILVTEKPGRLQSRPDRALDRRPHQAGTGADLVLAFTPQSSKLLARADARQHGDFGVHAHRCSFHDS